MLGIDGSNVVGDQSGPVRAAVVDGVRVVVGEARGEVVAELPEEVGAHTVGVEGGRLPGTFNGDMVVWISYEISSRVFRSVMDG